MLHLGQWRSNGGVGEGGSPSKAIHFFLLHRGWSTLFFSPSVGVSKIFQFDGRDGATNLGPASSPRAAVALAMSLIGRIKCIKEENFLFC